MNFSVILEHCSLFYIYSDRFIRQTRLTTLSPQKYSTAADTFYCLNRSWTLLKCHGNSRIDDCKIHPSYFKETHFCRGNCNNELKEGSELSAVEKILILWHQTPYCIKHTQLLSSFLLLISFCHWNNLDANIGPQANIDGCSLYFFSSKVRKNLLIV